MGIMTGRLALQAVPAAVQSGADGIVSHYAVVLPAASAAVMVLQRASAVIESPAG